MRQVLLLNGGQVLRPIPWTRAMTLVFKNKAVELAHFDDVEINTVSQSFKLPSVISLKDCVYIPFKEVAINKKNVMRRDGGVCQYCGRRVTESTATIDHIVPRSRGGTNSWKNVCCACKECNNKKDDKTPEQVGMNLMKDPKETKAPSLNIYLEEYLRKDPYAKAWAAYI